MGVRRCPVNPLCRGTMHRAPRPSVWRNTKSVPILGVQGPSALAGVAGVEPLHHFTFRLTLANQYIVS
jgi:hypothetical protein